MSWPGADRRRPGHFIGGVVESQVTDELKEFIISMFLFGDETRLPAEADSLLETGVLDSTGVLELIEFLEECYQFTVEDTETVPDNLGSIAGLTRYVLRKTGETAGAA